MFEHEKFLKKYYSSATEPKQEDVKRFLAHLENISGGITPEIFTDKKMLCKAFFLQATGSISRGHYQKIKEYLLNLLDFCNTTEKIPTRTEVISSREVATYFESIEQLLSFIDQVGEIIDPRYNPIKDLVRLKGICVLGWLGFTTKEIADFKVVDLQQKGFNAFTLKHESDELEISGKSFAVLYHLINLTDYKSNGKMIILKGSEEYLFRPTTDDCDKIDEGHIIQILKRFNKKIPSYLKTAIMFRNLHKNALFLKIYEDSSNKSLIKKISDTMNCSVNSALNYKEQYLDFVNFLERKK